MKTVVCVGREEDWQQFIRKGGISDRNTEYVFAQTTNELNKLTFSSVRQLIPSELLNEPAYMFLRETLQEAMRRRRPIDPIDPHQPGAKLDADKVDLTLVPPELLNAVAQVMMFGEKKYTRGGWKQVPDAGRRYFSAMLRHQTAYTLGEELDPETGLHHLWHVATNAAFLVALQAMGTDIGDWRK